MEMQLKLKQELSEVVCILIEQSKPLNDFDAERVKQAMDKLKSVSDKINALNELQA